MRASFLPAMPAISPGPVIMSTSWSAVPVGLSARMAKRPGAVTRSKVSCSPAVANRSRSSVAAAGGGAGTAALAGAAVAVGVVEAGTAALAGAAVAVGVGGARAAVRSA